MNRYLLSTLFVAAGLFIPSFNAQEENRTIEETLAILWKIVSKLPRNEITKIKDKFVDQYYQGE